MKIQQFPDEKRFLEMAGGCNVLPVCAEILADTETPVSLLQKIRTQGQPVFLFESVEGGERWGRYSFLGTSPHCRIRVYRDFVSVKENGTEEKIPHNQDPIRILRELSSRYRPPVIPELPRFWGGMVGYFCYEMVSFFENIPSRMPEDRPIADFMIPDELVIFDNIRHTLFALVIAFTTHEKKAEDVYAEAIEKLDCLVDKIGKRFQGSSPGKDTAGCRLTPVLSDESYRDLVRKTKTNILEGDIIQAVISQPFFCEPAPDLWNLYRAQRFINPSPYLFFMEMDDTALVGSSPETMVRLENGVASLRPIAGTRPRGKTEQEDRALADELLKDEKERAEHLMLVDLGRNDLGRVSEIGSVQVTDLMMVERYSHVMHLVSNIRGDLKPEYDAWDLIGASFPAGTLSGAPKIRAMEIIAELEDGPRGPYGGCVGYVSFDGNMDVAITIRTACIENGRLTVRAGAGIVADSDPETERMETVNKAGAIRRALSMIRESS